jgi:hypothetical protein
MLSDTDAGHMAIAVSLCLRKKKENMLLDQKMVQRKTTTHTHKSYERLKA